MKIKLNDLIEFIEEQKYEDSNPLHPNACEISSGTT